MSMSDEIEEKWMDLDFISQVFKECSCESCDKTFHNSDCLNENMTQEHDVLQGRVNESLYYYSITK